MSHSAQLRALATLLEDHDLTSATLDITVGSYGLRVEAYYSNLEETERRDFKKCFGPLKESGDPPYVVLRGWAPLDLGDGETCKVTGVLQSAFECKIVRTKQVTSSLSDWMRDNYEKQIERMKASLETGETIRDENEYSCEPNKG